MSILESIYSPIDIKKLTLGELALLSEEIRNEILTVVSANGGHLSSNLGAVELTLACHRCFHSPADKIVFDVGHQSYTHKLITGRYHSFSTLRTYGGISGFTRPTESPHDICVSGHSSTSVSTAAGISAANRLSGKDNFTVAIIGDGATTGGLAFEGLNNAPSCGKVIVVLNDNDISISKNVGSLSRHLTELTSHPDYFKLKDKTTHLVLSIPFLGKPLKNFISRTKSMIKDLLTDSNLFEHFGFEYYGPIDGHDIERMCHVLERAKERGIPALIHVKTVKGKGVSYAEKNPSLYHGVPKFDKLTGSFGGSSNSFSASFGKKLTELATQDTRIVAITAAMGMGVSLTDFETKFPNRYFDVGIAEQHGVTFSAGLAIGGKKPFFAVYSTFLQRAYDQLIHDVSIGNLPVVIGIDRAGITGEDGETHHGVFDVSYLNPIPHFQIFSPANYAGLHAAMEYALEADGPVAIRYPRGKEAILLKGEEHPFFRIYGPAHAKLVILTYGRLTANCILAAERLEKVGLVAKVISLERIKPIDFDALFSCIAKDSQVFFIEEGMRRGGIGETCASRFFEMGACARFHILAIEDAYVPHGNVEQLMKDLGFDSQGIANFINERVTT